MSVSGGVDALLRGSRGVPPERVAYRFIDDDGAVATLTFGELDERVRAVGAALRRRALTGHRCLLLFDPGLDFIVAFLGCLDAGVVAVPAYPPEAGRVDRALPRLVAVARDADARALLTTEAMADRAFAVVPEDSPLRALQLLTVRELSAEGPGAEGGDGDRSRPSLDPVFLQYTSGSTGDPRGVCVGWSELLATLSMWKNGSDSGPHTRVVTWAPFYHDLGLITGVLHPLFVGAESTLMSPMTFLRRPRAWLEACTTYGADMTAAPNFALDLCASRVADLDGLDLSALEVLIVGGEPAAAATLRRFVRTFEPAGLRREAMYVGYGLAEAVVSVFGGPLRSGWAERRLDAVALQGGQATPASAASARVAELVSCGLPLQGVRGRIVDESTGAPVPDGQVGEIWVQGANVCSGYWRRPEDNERAFGATLAGEEGPWLRTGDLGFMDGEELFVTGRTKEVVIVRGRNHYPQDLERAVADAHPAVRSGGIAAFSWRSDRGEQVGLAVEIRLDSLQSADGGEVAVGLGRALAAATGVGAGVIALLRPGGLPKTSSGKLRRLEAGARVARWVLARRAGEEVDATCVAVHVAEVPGDGEDAPEGDWAALLRAMPAEDRAAALVGWLAATLRARGIAAGPGDAHTPIWDLGVDSQAAATLLPDVSQALGLDLSGASLVEHPSAAALARHALATLGLRTGPLTAGAPTAPAHEVAPAQMSLATGGVAIVGMGCRFPGGVTDPDSFWELIEAGVDAIREVPEERWDAHRLFDPDGPARGRCVTRWGGFIGDVGQFDAALFGVSAREAKAMDPAHRLLLQTSWQALEHAGLDPMGLHGTATAVYVGAVSGEYGQLQMAAGHQHAGGWLASGNAASAAGGRLSYFYGFQGPNVSIDTACSSSLVAVHQAVTSLLSGEADLALAGGVNVLLNPGLTVALSQAGMMSRDGRCKAFDASADGYVRSEGCGLVVLKRLEDAVRAGDPIRAVIRGSAVNQDGRSSHLTAPSEQAQQAVIRAALGRAGVTPADVSYVEAHGTGTPIGDPIEAAALGATYGIGREAPLAIGSVKTQIGHTELAAGVAGLIRAVLALERGVLPPSLHHGSPNPEIAWDRLGVRVQTSPSPWRGPRRAGVSAFGFSGTNAHVVVEGAAAAAAPAASAPGPHTICLSAHTGAALQRWAGAVADVVSDGTDLGRLADSVRRRASLPVRLAVPSVVTADDLVGPLRAAQRAEDHPGLLTGHGPRAGTPSVALLFPGQGSQFAGMGRQLYEADPGFRAAFDACDAASGAVLGHRVAPIVLADDDPRLDRTRFTQPALFAVQVALVTTLRARGVRADHLLGHSVGELTAAWASGALSLHDAATLVGHRARAMDEAPADGGMLAVALGEDEVLALAGDLEVAAVNAPDQTVVAGPVPAIEALRRLLEGRGVGVTSLRTSHAFHSAAMQHAAQHVVQAASGLTWRTPQTPWIGNVDGQRHDRVPDPEHWGRQLRGGVRFADGLRALRQAGADVVVEVGPGTALSALVRRNAPDWQVPTVPTLVPGRPAAQALERALGALYCAGVDTRSGRPSTPLMSLPSYPFERTRWWDDAARPDRRRSAQGATVSGPAVSGAVVTRTYTPPYGPLIADHVLRGRVVVSGAALAAQLIEACAATRPGAVVLDDLTFERPLLPPAEGEMTVEAHVDDDGAATVHAHPGDGRWRLICRAQRGASVGRTDAPGPEPVDAPAMDARAFYGQHAARGYELGPSYRRLQGVRALGVRATASVSASDAEALVDAGALDSAFQLVGALVADPDDDDLRVPVRIARIHLRRGAGPPARVEAALRGGGPIVADLRIDDDDGEPVMELEGLELAPLPVQALEAETRPVTWRVQWSPGGISPAPSHPPVRLLGDDPRADGVAAALRAAGRTVTDEPAAAQQLVWLAPDGPIEELARVVRQAATGRSGLWCVTTAALPREGSPIHAEHRGLWGLMRVLQAEAPAAFGGIIDLPRGGEAQDALVEALGARAGLQARIDPAGVSLPQLIPLRRSPAATAALPFDPDCACLITGGAGRVGLALAADLLSRGARHVVLVGRRPAEALPAGARQLLERPEVRYERADVGAPGEVASLVGRLDGAGPPLRAVFHGAGRLVDGLLGELAEDDLRSVAAPKIDAARALDEATRGLALDTFVVFSSAAAVLGAVGQGAYARANLQMEAVVLDRRKEGLAGVAIRFGPWQGGGMVTDAMAARWRAAGVTPLSPERALGALYEVLRADVALATVLDARWSALASSLGITAPSLLPTADPDDSRGRGWLTARLVATVDAQSRRELLIATVRQRLASSLGVEASGIAVDAPLAALGVDSLVTLELAYALEHGLDRPVPGATLTSLGDVQSVVSWVIDEVGAPAPAADSGPATRGAPLATSAQRRLLWVERRHPGTALQHMQVALHVDGAVDAQRLQGALDAVVAAHEALRMGLSGDPEAPRVRLAPAATAPLGRGDDVARVRLDDGAAPFDLDRPPLLRATLVAGDPGDAVVITVHHLVADGWSVANLLRDLAAAYEGGPVTPAAQISDIARDEASWLATHADDESEAWAEALAGWRPRRLPRRPDAEPGVAGRTLTLRWPAERTAALTAAAQARGCTLFEALLTCTSLTLGRATGSRDPGLATVVSGRLRAAWADVVGMVANTVPVRMDLRGATTLGDALTCARDAARFADRHGRLPYDQVLRQLDPPARQPLDVLLVLENLPLPDARLGGLPVTVVTDAPDGSVAGTAKFPLTVACDHDRGGLRLAFTYRTGQFTEAQVQSWLDAFDRIAAALGEDADLALIALQDAAFVAPTPERIHLADVLPDGRRRLVTPLRAVEPTDPSLVAGPGAAAAYVDGGPLEMPGGRPSTLGEALERTARRWGDSRGVTYVGPAGQTDHQGYATLHREALRILGGYQASGLRPGDVVIHQLADLRRHFTSFQACVLGGLVPVTVATPTAAEGPARRAVLDKLAGTWRRLGRPAIVTDVDPAGLAAMADGDAPRVLAWQALSGAEPGVVHPADPDDVVFLQLSSGSTGASKAIEITHAGVLSHVEASRQHNGVGDADSTLNWLPVDHVVPMLTVHLQDVVLGLPEVQVATGYVLTDPLRWLALLQAHGVTRTWAPNFGYRLVTEALEAACDGEYALAHVRQLLNAGEQVTLAVVRAFLDATGRFGISPSAMQPSFGMAEACTCMTYRTGFDVDSAGRWASAGSLGGQLELTDGPAPGATHFVDLGGPVAGVELRIADAAGRTLREGVIGRFQIRGDVVTPGYRGDDDASAAAFAADGWFDSGDLGFLADGHLFLTGRAKEQIVVRGANVFCHEIEQVAGGVQGLAPDGQAAVPVADADGGQEGFALFVTPADGAWGRRDELAAAARRRLGEALGLTARLVVPLKPGELPRTTSGKLQRARLGVALAAGEYDRRLLAPDADTLPHAFHTRTWVRAPRASVDPAGAWLIVADDQGLGAALAQRVGGRLVDVEGLRGAFDAGGIRPDGVVDLRGWGSSDGPSYAAERLERRAHEAVGRVIELADALADGPDVRLRVVVGGLGDSAGAAPDPVSGMVAAAVRTLGQEQPWIKASVIDLPLTPPEAAVGLAAASLDDDEPEIAWVDGRRWVPRFVAAPLVDGGAYPFRAGETWLLTGGLGGVGRRLAAALLDRGVEVVCLCRQIASAERRRAVDELSERGALRLMEADVTDLAAVRAALDEVGELHGVIHLATGYDVRPLAGAATAELLTATRAKWLGAWTLDRALGDRPVPLITVGSLNGVFGGFHAGGYSAANRFVELLAARRRARGLPARCLAFSLWTGVGISSDRPTDSAAARHGFLSLPPTEATSAALVALAHGQAEMWVGLDRHHERMASWLLQPPPPRPAEPRRTAAPVAPATDTERTIAELWTGVLGGHDIDVTADFFELGGDSLAAVRLAGGTAQAFPVDLDFADVFAHPTVRAIAAHVDGARPAAAPPTDAGDGSELSSDQRRLWFLQQLDPESPRYNVALALRLTGPVDDGTLRAAFGRAVDRHEALRTRIVQVDGAPRAEVLPNRPPAWVDADLGDATLDDAIRLVQESAARPFDLADEPLLRLTLVRLSEREHVLGVVVHHIVVDGWSLGQLVSEVGVDLAGQSPPLPAWQPRDHVAWRRRQDARRDEAPLLDWWRAELADLPPAELPTDRPRSARRTHRGAVTRRSLAVDQVEALRAVAAAEGATVFAALVAGLGAALGHEGSPAISAIGTPVATRGHADLESMVGFLVNTVVLRTDTSGDPTFRALVARTGRICQAALTHAAAPFHRLVDALRPARDPGRNPLFDVLLVLQETPGLQAAWPGVQVEELPVHTGAARFDLHLAARTGPAGLQLELEYDTDLYAPATAALLLEQLEAILGAGGRAPDRRLSELTADVPRRVRRIAIASTFPSAPLVAPTRQAGALVGRPVRCDLAAEGPVVDALLNPASPLAADADLAVLLLGPSDVQDDGAAWAASLVRAADAFTRRTRTPVLALVADGGDDPVRDALLEGLGGLPAVAVAGRPATRQAQGPIPYPDAWYRATAVGIHRHLDLLHRPPVKMVAVDADDTLWRGVLAEDGPDGVVMGGPHRWLQERLAALAEAGVLVAIVSRNDEADVRQALAARQDFPLRPEHVAGWAVGWRAKSAGLTELAQELDLGLDAFLFVDDSPVEIAEVSAALPQVRTLGLPPGDAERLATLEGAWTLDPPAPGRHDPERTRRYRADRHRQASRQGAVDFAAFLDGLAVVVDVRPLDDATVPRAAELSLRTNQLNTTTRRRGEAELGDLAALSAGRAWTVAARDRFGDHGVVGLIIAEPGDAWRVTDLLLSCRVLGRGVEHAVLRWVGDRAAEAGAARVAFDFAGTPRNTPARRLLEAVGGAVAGDDGEVVVEVPALRRAAPVTKQEAPTQEAGAELTPVSAAPPDGGRLLNAESLAAAMRSGPGQRRRRAGGDPPANPAERAICAVIEQVLGVDRVARDDDFFLLGGDSLLAVRLVDPLSEALDRRVRLVDVFATPTPAALAEALGASDEAPGPVIDLSGGPGPPLWLVHALDGDLACYLPLVEQLGGRFAVRGLRARGLDPGEAPEGSFDGLVQRYVGAVLDAQPEGPFRLGGWSMGGGIALAMAAQLQERGREVRWIALIDTRPPAAWRRATGEAAAMAAGGAHDPPSDADRRVHAVTRTHAAAYLQAELPTVDVPITLIHGDEAGPLPSAAGPADWQGWGTVRAVQASGHHFNLLDADHVGQVAEALIRL